MKYKAVVSDLDGTLLNSKNNISKESIEVIKNLMEKGIKFFIATGRHHLDVEYIMSKDNLKTGIITSNGAIVIDENKNELIRHEIKGEIARELFSKIDFRDSYVNVYKNDIWYINKEWEEAKLYIQDSGFEYTIRDLDTYGDKDICKIFVISENHDLLVELEKEMLSSFSHKLTIVFSGPNCLEVMAHGVNKAKSLEEILNIYDISLEETIAFGDGFNDYEMLKKVGKGFVMGNAHYKLKNALCKNPLIGTNDENAVAKKIKEIFEI